MLSKEKFSSGPSLSRRDEEEARREFVQGIPQRGMEKAKSRKVRRTKGKERAPLTEEGHIVSFFTLFCRKGHVFPGK